MNFVFSAFLIQLIFQSATAEETPPVPLPAPAPAPEPCSCGNGHNAGVCTISPVDSKPWCICEDTFEVTYNSKGKPICTCPNETLLSNMNRCIPITTESPFKPPTSSPTQTSTTDSPTDLVTNVPTSVTVFSPNDDCKDNTSFTFTLTSSDIMVGCDWITSNNKRIITRKDNYCDRADVKGACQNSCDNCLCKDAQDFTFTLPNNDVVDCSYITKNSKNTDIRRNKFCFTDIHCREASSVGNACPAACGFCDASSTESCNRTEAPVPTKMPSIVGKGKGKGYGPAIKAPSKGY